MRALTVPNWSFGRDPELLDVFRSALAGFDVAAHYAASDVDHNRTVTAFSGETGEVEKALLRLCEAAFGRIDMRRHQGVHPRIGALDVCPIVPLKEGDEALREALALAERLAARIGDVYEVPVFLYERSERGRHEADLPNLRRGGFEGLLDRELSPDFGPSRPHPSLGVTVLGVREFLIAFNVDLATDQLAIAREIASEIRQYRADGDPRFLGVRALGFPLASRRLAQVSLNLTLPDATGVDPIIEWIEQRAAINGVLISRTELVGVIRRQDVERATELPIAPEQVVEYSAKS
jgi:glutamate formiminotransferase